MTDDHDMSGIGFIIIAVLFIVCILCDICQERAPILPVHHEHRTIADSHQQAYVPARNTVNAGPERSVACVAPAPRVNPIPASSETWTRTSDRVGQSPWAHLPTFQTTSDHSLQTESYGAVNGDHSTLAPLHQYVFAANRASASAAISGQAPTHRTVPVPSESSTRVRSLASPIAQQYALPPFPSQATSGPSQINSLRTVGAAPSAEATLLPGTSALFQSYGSTDTALLNVATVSPAPKIRDTAPAQHKTCAGLEGVPAEVVSPACPLFSVHHTPPYTAAPLRTEHVQADDTPTFDQRLRGYEAAGVEIAPGLSQYLKASGVRADEQINEQEPQVTYYSLENAERLRARAKAELRKRKEMLKKVRKERNAINARAMRQLSETHEFEHKRLNQEAADMFFRLNNDGLPPSKIDLHNLTVDEAIKFARARICKAREDKFTSITFITGKGVHSENNEARIKPALQKWLKEQNLVVKIQRKNEGRLVVGLETGSEDVAIASLVYSCTRRSAKYLDNDSTVCLRDRLILKVSRKAIAKFAYSKLCRKPMRCNA